MSIYIKLDPLLINLNYSELMCLNMQHENHILQNVKWYFQKNAYNNWIYSKTQLVFEKRNIKQQWITRILCHLELKQYRYGQKYISPVVASKTAVLSATWELSRASIVNLYMMFGDRELTEPKTVFGPNVT